MTPTRRVFLKQLGFTAGGIAFLASGTSQIWAAEAGGLARSTPEAEGISSAAIQAFLDAVAAKKIELHSFMLARHGKVIAEGWWAPYAAKLNHGLYSVSKSFTSTAIGMLVAEGKLTVDDKIVSFFPDDLPAKVSDNLAAMRVRDLLSMAAGHDKDPTFEIMKAQNWVKAFLAWPVPNKPGTNFVYNSGGTYTLSAIVQKLTGQTVLEYLKPRLFEPLGIEGATWEVCPRGINCGGWGLSVPTEALAKFAQLYLQKGMWNGKQLIPAKWVEEATTAKIQQPLPDKPARPNERNDWVQGYCYQFWRCTHGGVRGDGAFGQFAIVLPEQDAVLAITAQCTDMQTEIDLVWEHLLPAMKEKALPEDAAAQAKLQETLAGLQLPPPKGEGIAWPRFEGKTYQLEPNDLGWQTIKFYPRKGGVDCTVTDDKGEAYSISNNDGGWLLGTTAVPGLPPRLGTGGRPPQGTKYKIAASATGRKDGALEMTWRFYETPNHETLLCKFTDNKLEVTFTNPLSPGKKTPLRGTVKS